MIYANGEEKNEYAEWVLRAWYAHDDAAVLKLLSLNPEDKGSIPHFLEWYLNEHGGSSDGWKTDFLKWDADRKVSGKLF